MRRFCRIYSTNLPSIPKHLESEKQLAIPVQDSDVQSLYEALQTPIIASNSPLKLPPSYLHNLKLSFDDLQSQKYQDLMEKSSASVHQLPTLQKISQVIHVNAKTNRPNEAQAAFDTIHELGLTPDIVAYNHLMNAYARVGNAEKVSKLLEMMKSNGLTPDIITYSTLISAYVKREDLDSAFKVYSSLKKLGLKANQIVYSTLIKGCIVKKQFERAWKTFDHFREHEQPDGIAYSIMIRACSYTKDAERALDLFEEMASKNVPANQDTYNSLIKACGTRTDYYNDAFNLLEQMITNGFDLNTESYSILFEIVAANRDIARARLLWNDFAARIDFEKLKDKSVVYSTPPLVYKPYLAGNLFKLYKNVLIDGPIEDPKVKLAEIPFKAPKLVDSELKPSQILHEPQLPLIETTETSSDAIVKEADWLWHLQETLAKEGKMQINGVLLNKRLEQLCACPGPDAVANAFDFLKTKFNEYNVPIKGSSYLYLLQAAWKDGANEVAIKIWKDFLDWDAKLEQKLTESCEITPKSIPEKEVARFEQARTARAMSEAFLTVAKGYDKAGDLKMAIETLKDMKNFRFPYYIMPVKPNYIRDIMESAKREVDMGNLEPLRELEQICLKSMPNPLEVARHHLKSKFVPGSWWGWEAMGISETEKKNLMRKQRENAKAIQHEMTLRQKAEVSAKNRESKLKLFKPVI